MFEHISGEQWNNILNIHGERLVELATMADPELGQNGDGETTEEQQDIMADILLDEAERQGYSVRAVAKMLMRFQMSIGQMMRDRDRAMILALNGVTLTTEQFQP